MAASENKSYIAGIGLKGSNGAIVEDNIPIVVDYRNVIVDFGASTKRLDDILFGAYDKEGHQIGLYTSMGEQGKDNPLFDPQKNSFFQYWKDQKDHWDQLVLKYESEWEPFRIDKSDPRGVVVTKNEGEQNSALGRHLHYSFELGRQPRRDYQTLLNIGTAKNASTPESGMYYRLMEPDNSTGVGYLCLRGEQGQYPQGAYGRRGCGQSTLRFENGGGFGSNDFPAYFFTVYAPNSNGAEVAMVPSKPNCLTLGRSNQAFKSVHSVRMYIGDRGSQQSVFKGLAVWEGGVYIVKGGLRFGSSSNPMMMDLQKDPAYDGQANYMNYRVSFVNQGVTINDGGLAIKHNGLRIFNDGGITVDADGIRIENGGLWVKRGGISFGGNSERMLDIYDDPWYTNSSHTMRYRLGFSRGVTIDHGGLAIKENGARIRGGLHLETGGIILGGLGNPMMIDLQLDPAYSQEAASYMKYRVSFLNFGVTIDKGGLAIKNNGLRIFEGGQSIDNGGLIIQRGGLKFGNPQNQIMLDLKHDDDYAQSDGLKYRVTFQNYGVTIEKGGLAIKQNGFRIFDGGQTIENGGLNIQRGGLKFGASENPIMLDLKRDPAYENQGNPMEYRTTFQGVGVTIEKGGLAIKERGIKIFSGGMIIDNGGLNVQRGGLRFGDSKNKIMLDLVRDGAYLNQGNPMEYRTTFQNYGVTIEKGGLAIKQNGLRIFSGGMVIDPVEIYWDDNNKELKFKYTDADGNYHAFSMNFKNVKNNSFKMLA